MSSYMEKQHYILELRNFSLYFPVDGKPAYAVDSVSLGIGAGETVALVGESGCGKTMTALSCMGLQPDSAVIAHGGILLDGTDVVGFDDRQWNSIRGKRISMIFQKPMSALDPLVPVGKQIIESGIAHGMPQAAAKKRAVDLMGLTNLPVSAHLYNSYPHQLSGGQRQRVMIAGALMNEPELLIADEPTSSLDVTIQAQIIELLHTLNTVTHTAILLITHDLGIVRTLCTKVFIMYAGRIVESGYSDQILTKPAHPYTRALLDSLPSVYKRNVRLPAIEGTIPSLGHRPGAGCLFYGRCQVRKTVCATTIPMKIECENPSHTVYCHLYDGDFV